MTTLSDNRDAAFSRALASAEQMKAAGDITRFMVERCSNRGRTITVETDQGWDPEPMFCDFYPDRDPQADS